MEKSLWSGRRAGAERKLSRNNPVWFSKSVLCLLVCKVKGLDHCMISKSPTGLCFCLALRSGGGRDVVRLKYFGALREECLLLYLHWHWPVCWFDFCQSWPGNYPLLSCFFWLRKGRRLTSRLQPETKSWAQWKARWGTSLWVEDRVNKEAKEQGSIPWLLGQGEESGPHA